jgi:integrase
VTPAPREPTRYPGVYRRGNRYVVRYRDGQGKERQQGGFRTAKAGADWKRRRDADIADGVWMGENRIAFDGYAAEWIEAYQGRGRRGFRESTREDYRRALDAYAIKYFSARLGRTLAQISPRDVNVFIGWLCDAEAQREHQVKLGWVDAKDSKPVELSDSRIRNIIAPLRSCLATAVEDGLIRSNPADRARLPNREHLAGAEDEDLDEEIKALGPDQLQTFLKAIAARDRRRRGGQSHLLLFELLAATGLRWSEAAPLTWRYLELSGEPKLKVRWQTYRGRRVRPKSKYGRRDVPLPVELANKLRRHRLASGRPGEDDLVFASLSGGQLDHSNMMRDVVRKTAIDVGLPWITFHTFRHTCASMLFAEGRNAVQVQRWLGHHSPAFTLSRYVHLLEQDLGAALDTGAPAVQLGLLAEEG